MATQPIVRVLEARGGVMSSAELRRWHTKREIQQAVEAGRILRDARGHYALPTADEGLRAARRLSAVAIGRTAAAFWGWRLKTQPPSPEIAVPRGRRVSAADRQLCQVSWRALGPEDLHSRYVTSKVRAP